MPDEQYAVTYTGGGGYRMDSWGVDVTPANPVHKTKNPDVAQWLVENADFEYQDHTRNKLEERDDTAVYEELEDLDDVGPKTADELREHGFESVADLRGVDPETIAEEANLNDALAESIADQVAE